MQTESIYYQSPIGILDLKMADEKLQCVSFLRTADSNTNAIIECKPAVSTILQQTVCALDQYFSGENLAFNLPIAQPGTGFQQSVWTALQKIKPGSTCSYLQLSKNLGNPKAIRAVGTANGKNNIAIIVPCHRVIGSDGSLIGYAGELWRKKWLLNHEAKYCNGLQTLFD